MSNVMTITLDPIGIIHSPFTELENMPIQPAGAKEIIGTLEILPQYAEGLADLGGFSHLYLLYLFHRAQRTALTVIPFLDTVERGVFATRSPLRPNHLGISIVELLEVRGNEVRVRGVDILDNTPLLDIKPYIANFDQVGNSSSGWMKAGRREVAEKLSDGRFT
jgi:tRNA-Thr(GGU) m(6)t(6)A37 methyltransferase TsaA